ncbi:LysR family transcriptional regulator [Acidithiobacillus concretivorus]|uniref:LysR family transcriptional regulator n=1 Tax=Acidithiobacillus concretivorus TaxID=3063952 RepID=A0ABS5ZTQ6_9PROT|nr:LysR family transcriptional regulator [Acidithiobacillus concretivorus]MBU2740076.1 LysR family transcriptional regulator [Acidithiobacillus concretivorus]
MKHLRLFKYVDAIVREGSVRRAADKLHITASALDRRVQDLEDELGSSIFERHPRGMRLTAAGEVFLVYVRRHLSDMQRLRSEIDSLNGLRRGQVSLAVSPALASDFIPRIINTFRAQYPGVSFAVNVAKHADAIRALLAFEVDLAIIVAPPRHPDVIDLAISEQPLVAAMHNRHPLAQKTTLRFSDCVQYPLVIPAPGLTSREMLEPALHNAASEIQIAAETNSYEIMRGMLHHSENIGFVISTGMPKESIHEHIVYKTISALDIRPVPLVCAQLKSRGISVAAARFSNCIAEELNEMTHET